MSLGIINIIAVLLFLYLTWRNLKEDYKSERIISYSWLALIAFLVGSRVVYGLLHWGEWNDSFTQWLAVWQLPGLNYLGGYGSMLMVTIWFAFKNDWKLWPLCEQLINSFMVFIFLIFTDEFVRSGMPLEVGIYLCLLLLCWAAANMIKSRYRSYVWYKSGKKGFAFFFVNALWWFLFCGVSWWLGKGILLTVLSLLLAAASLIGLLVLGEVFNLSFAKRRK